MIDFSERVRRLSVHVDAKPGGELVRASHAAGLDDRIPQSMLKQLSAEWRDSISMFQLQTSRSKR